MRRRGVRQGHQQNGVAASGSVRLASQIHFYRSNGSKYDFPFPATGRRQMGSSPPCTSGGSIHGRNKLLNPSAGDGLGYVDRSLRVGRNRMAEGKLAGIVSGTRGQSPAASGPDGDAPLPP